METFKQVPGYEALYEISNMGVVRSVRRRVRGNGVRQPERVICEKRMTVTPDTHGYASVSLSRNGSTKKFRVHRLVMNAFCQRQDSRELDVNHINGDKMDNRLENLEWATRGENHVHRYQVLGQKHSMTGRFGSLHHRSVAVVGAAKDGGGAVRFDSLMDAQRAGFSASKISLCLSGSRASHAGRTWKAPDMTQFV